MKKNYGYISKESTNRDLLIISKGLNVKSTRYLPVIDNYQDKHLVGVIETRNISTFLENEVNTESQQYDLGSAKLFVKFYNKLLTFKGKDLDSPGRSGSVMYSNEEKGEDTLDNAVSSDIRMKRIIGNFWYTKVKIDSPLLKLDKSPFCILSATPVSKVHFLFAMLNLKYAMVINEGRLVGTLSRSYFVKKMKEL
jgi:hypothetical protein